MQVDQCWVERTLDNWVSLHIQYKCVAMHSNKDALYLAAHKNCYTVFSTRMYFVAELPTFVFGNQEDLFFNNQAMFYVNIQLPTFALEN